PGGAMAGRFHRQTERCHIATLPLRSFQWRNTQDRIAAARSSSCVPSCKVPASKSPRPPAVGVRCLILRSFAPPFFLHHSLFLLLHFSVVGFTSPNLSTLCSVPKRVPQLAATRKLSIVRTATVNYFVDRGFAPVSVNLWRSLLLVPL